MKGVLITLVAGALLAAGCDRALPVQSAQPEGAPQFPALTGRVVDRADLLPREDEMRLTHMSASLERELGPQFVIATVPSLEGWAIEDYGVQLGRAWGIGSRQRNDGVILLVAPSERRVRIEVGYGLESRVTDPFAARVLREQVLPRFRDADLRGGIIAGSEAIVARLRSRQTDREIAQEDHLVI